MSDAVVVPPRARDRSYPAELEAIVLQALARDPAQRHATARALQGELTAFAAARGLDLSAAALARLMASAYGPELTAWHTAERRGATLEQHITSLTQQRTLEWQRPAAAGAEDAAPAQHASQSPAAVRAEDAAWAQDAPQSPAAVRAEDAAPAQHVPQSPAAVRAEDAAPAQRMPRSRLRSRLVTIALIAAVAIGLVATGALGALWLTR